MIDGSGVFCFYLFEKKKKTLPQPPIFLLFFFSFFFLSFYLSNLFRADDILNSLQKIFFFSKFTA